MYRVYKDSNFLFKLLPVLFIILFLFMCFSPIVFGFHSSILEGEIIIPKWFTDYNYLIIYEPNYSNVNHYAIYLSKSPIEMYRNGSSFKIYNTNNTIIYSSSVLDYKDLNDFNSELSSLSFSRFSSAGDGYITSLSFNMSSSSGFVCNHDILSHDNHSTVLVNNNNPNSSLVYPYFMNKDEVSSGDFKEMRINAGDFKNAGIFYLHKLEVDSSISDDTGVYYYSDSVVRLSSDSDYYDFVSGENGDPYYYYVIPYDYLKIDKEKEYIYILNDNASTINNSSGILTEDNFEGFDFIHLLPKSGGGEVVPPDEPDPNQGVYDKFDEQTNQLKENNETNKGIWGTLKDLLSFINPFSENFFVYKLIDLLMDLLKALFIPDTDFFSNWFSDLNDSFSDQFGILYYPVACIIDVLSSLNDVLTTQEPIINVPAFSFDFFSKPVNIWNATSYNFNDLLSNPSIKQAHDIYLFFVNVMFTIGVLGLASKIASEIFGGVDDSVNSYFDNNEDAQIRRYSQGVEVRKKYNQRLLEKATGKKR